jgi:hypothetical protein
MRNASEAELLNLFHAGLKNWPDDLWLYYDVLLQLSRRWNNDKVKIEQFIGSAADATRHTYGDSFYVDLYWSIAKLRDQTRIFEQFDIDWPRMRRAMSDRLRRNPGSYFANRYAYLACLAGDQDLTRMMLDQVGHAADPVVWQAEAVLARCWTWSHAGQLRGFKARLAAW